MPSKRTLQRALQKCDVVLGFSDRLVDALIVKVQSMSEQDRPCAMVFDEMSLQCRLTYNARIDSIEGFDNLGNLGTSKYIANHAVAFIVRGLASKWKQPIGYFLTSGTVSPNALKSLLPSAVHRLTSVGLNVISVICDQGANNRSMINYLDVTPEKTFFLNEPPHLIKNVRNNFKMSICGMGQRFCSIFFFEFDNKNPVEMAPKLTHKHI